MQKGTQAARAFTFYPLIATFIMESGNGCLNGAYEMHIEFECIPNGEFYTAKGYLPKGKEKEAIIKLTRKDLHELHADGTLSGIVRGVIPQTERGYYLREGALTKHVMYSIEPEDSIGSGEEGKWFIELIGIDKDSVNRAAKKMNDRLLSAL